MSDAELVSSVLSGDTRRFEALVDRYLPMVRALCASHVYTEAVHDDLVQETFVEGYLKLNTLRRADRFGPWLAQIARRKCQTWLRREGSKQRAMNRLTHESAPPPDPVSEMARAELQAWVRDVAQGLPVKTREAVLLYYLEGYSVSETARCLGVREGAVKKRLQYGRELLGDAVRGLFGYGPEAQSRRDNQKKRVLAALPLAAAPWLKTGTAAAATGAAATAAGGLSISTTALYTVSVLIVASVAIGGWQLWASRPPSGRLDLSDQSDSSDASDANSAMAPQQAPEAAAPSLPAAENAATGGLMVQVHFEIIREEEIIPGTFTTRREDGPPVPEAIVHLVPLRFNQKKFGRMMDQAGIDGRMREFLKLRFTAAGKETFLARTEALGISPGEISTAAQKLAQVEGFKEIESGLFDFLDPLFEQRQEAIADSAGTILFEALPAGTYALRAWAAREFVDDNRDFDIWDNNVERVLEGRKNKTTVQAEDLISRIHGRVVNAETGEPVLSAEVFLTGEMTEKSEEMGQTDENGNFNFYRAGYGKFEVRLGPGWGGDSFQGVRRPGEPVSVELKARGGIVSGTVLTHDGAPAAGISIMRENAQGGGSTGVASTDEHGAYSFYHDGGVVKIRAGCGTVESDWKTLELNPNEPATADFSLEPAARVVLDIRDDEGKTPENLENQTLLSRRGRSAATAGGNIARKEGSSYVIPYLSAGRYLYGIRTKDSGCGELEFDIPEASGEYRFEMHLVKPEDDLAVHVRDSHNRPIKEVHVSLLRIERRPNGRSGVYAGDMSADSEGICRFKGLLPGEYEVECEEVVAEVQFPRQQQVTLTLDPRPEQAPPVLSIREDCIVPMDGTRGNTPLSPRHCAVYALTPSGNVGNKLEVGANILYFLKPGYTLGVTELHVTQEQWDALTRAGSTAEWREPVEIVLNEDGGMYGSVTDAGNPVSGARIRVLPMELWQRAEAQGVPWTDMTSACDASGLARALAQNTETGADGSFRLRYLAPGYYVVGAPVRDAWAVSQPIEVRAGNETGPVALTAEQTKP